jgi:dihydropteroate synthase
VNAPLRKHAQWKLRTRTLALGERTLVMGVVNITPDSFSDGGSFLDPRAAVEHALKLMDEGADILDLGAESTRPGSRAGGADAAVRAGAEIVNDVSGFAWDPKMALVCATAKAGLVLMHTRGRPEDWRGQERLSADEVIEMVRDGLSASRAAARAAGVTDEAIVLDPGYGFGKRFEENYALLARQGELLSLGRPLLAGVSRKSFLGHTLGGLHGGQAAAPAERETASIAAMTAAILHGASVVRVHAVRAAKEAAAIADAILAVPS